jgi:hypothetical protein
LGKEREENRLRMAYTTAGFRLQVHSCRTISLWSSMRSSIPARHRKSCPE